MINRRRFITSSALGIAAAVPRPARSQTSHKLARLMVGFAPGGSLDSVARLLAEQLEGFAETVIVENRSGAGGRIALAALKTGPIDGTQMVLTPGDQLALFPHIYKSLAYDPVQDFATVCSVCTAQFLLTIGPLVPESVENFQTFVAWCRSNPKLANYGTPGAGTRQHFLGEVLSRAVGFDFVHVPFRGAAPAMQDQLAGQIAANISVISSALPNIEAGKLRAVMTSASRRSIVLPQVPTAREVGYPAFEAVEVFGLVLARGTPQATIDALNAATHRALMRPKLREGLSRLSLDPAGSTPEAFAALIRSDSERWSHVVRTSGFKPID